MLPRLTGAHSITYEVASFCHFGHQVQPKSSNIMIIIPWSKLFRHNEHKDILLSVPLHALLLFITRYAQQEARGTRRGLDASFKQTTALQRFIITSIAIHSIQTNTVLHFFHHNGALQAPLQWMDGPVSTQTLMVHVFVFTKSID